MTPLSCSVLIPSSPAAIFDLYRDAQAWPRWDAELSAADLPGGLATGAKGWLKPTKGPRVAITVGAVIPDRAFEIIATIPFRALPLCRIHFDHVLTPEGQATRVSHGVRFTGPLAPLFSRLMARDLRAGLPTTMAGLTAAASA